LLSKRSRRRYGDEQGRVHKTHGNPVSGGRNLGGKRRTNWFKPAAIGR
jgi:hypothetical protein